MTCRWLSCWLLATATLAAQALGQRQGPSTSPATAGGRSAQPPASEPGNWTSPAKTYQATRYSELDAITTENVRNLKEVWSFTTGVTGGHEGQPLVVNNTMYVVTPYPNRLFAFDLTRPGFPRKWQYQPPIAVAAPGKACCDVVNRGAAYADGKIIYNLLDNHTIAVDANSGREVWRTNMGDVNMGQTMTMAPLVVGTKVLVGNSGGEMGVRGWIAALAVSDGREIWRAYSTGPDADVRIGPGFKPFYASLRGKDMGVRSWRGDQWKLGGGTVWGWISYDPELHLIYYGTSNPGIWNAAQRPGDNMFATTLFARDPDTGEARWAWQATPHDMWDYDDVNESIVVDIPVEGQQRKVIVHFDRNGFATTIDRATGEVLVAQPYQFVNWAKGFDFKSGRPILDSTKMTHQGHLTRHICPSSTGARDQQPAAFSPRTRLFYTPSHNVCMDYGGVEAQYVAGTPYLGAAVRMYPGPGAGLDARGKFLAWDASTGREVWSITEKFPLWSGALATAGDLVFYGTLDGDFKAVHARTGKELWKTHFESGVVGNPISFQGPDGKQYIAVYSGVGGWMGAIVPGELSPDDPWAALGAVGAIGDLPDHTKAGGAVHVFALP